jgi:hypothetical protein
MYNDESVTDAVLSAVQTTPDSPLRRIVRTMRALGYRDAGVVRSAVQTLISDGYLTAQGKGGRETYRRA